MVTENNNFSSNAYHSFANDKVISKCKNDKSFFKIFRFSPFGGGNQNLLPTRFKKDEGGVGVAGVGGTMLSTSSCYFMKFVSNIVWQFSTTKTIPLVINSFIYLQTQYQIQKCPDDAKVKKVKDRIGTR